MSKILVLGMGNELLSDDAVGLLVAEEVKRVASRQDVEVKCAQIAGFKLVDLLVGFDKVIIIDAIISDRAPAGEAYWLDSGELRRPVRDKSNHNIHIADALELGKNLGLNMPREVKILAVEVEDCFTLAERVGDTARQAIPKAVEMVLDELGCSDKLL